MNGTAASKRARPFRVLVSSSASRSHSASAGGTVNVLLPCSYPPLRIRMRRAPAHRQSASATKAGTIRWKQRRAGQVPLAAAAAAAAAAVAQQGPSLRAKERAGARAERLHGRADE